MGEIDTAPLGNFAAAERRTNPKFHLEEEAMSMPKSASTSAPIAAAAPPPPTLVMSLSRPQHCGTDDYTSTSTATSTSMSTST